jgi:DNA-binding transcriptional MerR regulator
MEKSPEAFRTISEVAEELNLPQHVLRFWETRFAQIRPLKRGGGRRYYRPDDVELLRAIQRLLYGEGYTIKGVQKLLKEQGVKAMAASASEVADADMPPPAADDAPMAAVETAPVGTEPLDWLLREPPPARPIAAPQRAAINALHRADLERLQAALQDIVECERLLAAAQSV